MIPAHPETARADQGPCQTHTSLSSWERRPRRTRRPCSGRRRQCRCTHCKRPHPLSRKRNDGGAAGRRQRYHRQHPSQRNRRRKFLHVSAPLALRRSLLACARKRGTKLLFGERLATEQRFTSWMNLGRECKCKVWFRVAATAMRLLAGTGRRRATRRAGPSRPPQERSSRARFRPGKTGRIRSGIADKAASSGDSPRLRSDLGSPGTGAFLLA